MTGVPVLSRKKRDEALLGTIREVALQRKGTVLIPTDSAARVLELAYLLEQAWRKDQGLAGSGNTPGVELYLLGRRGKRLTKVVGRMLEWMDESVLKVLETAAPRQEADGPESGPQKKGQNKGRRPGSRFDQREQPQQTAAGAKLEASSAGPFDFVYVKILERRSQVEKMFAADKEEGRVPRGRVILSVDSSLEWGFSKDVLDRIASEQSNCILLTEVNGSGIARQLWDEWKERSKGMQEVYVDSKERELKVRFDFAPAIISSDSTSSTNASLSKANRSPPTTPLQPNPSLSAAPAPVL